MIIEFSILQFSRIELSPTLTFGPNVTFGPILQFAPIIDGPCIEEFEEISVSLPITVLPYTVEPLSITN